MYKYDIILHIECIYGGMVLVLKAVNSLERKLVCLLPFFIIKTEKEKLWKNRLLLQIVIWLVLEN